MIVELRTYHCAPGRLPALHERFTSTTLGFFEQYGIRQIGFWTNLTGATNQSLHVTFTDLPARLPRPACDTSRYGQ